MMTWGNGKCIRTIPLSKKSNVATFNLAPGFQAFKVFLAEADIDYDDECTSPICLDAGIVSNDEDEDHTHEADPESDSDTEPDPETASTGRREPIQTSFSLTPDQGPAPVTIEDTDEDTQPTNLAAEFLSYHQKYGHASPAKLQHMAQKKGFNTKEARKVPYTNMHSLHVRQSYKATMETAVS
jgi:hypothetical protein